MSTTTSERRDAHTGQEQAARKQAGRELRRPRRSVPIAERIAAMGHHHQVPNDQVPNVQVPARWCAVAGVGLGVEIGPVEPGVLRARPGLDDARLSRHLRIDARVWEPARRLAPRLFETLLAVVWRTDRNRPWTEVPLDYLAERTTAAESKGRRKKLRSELVAVAEQTGLIEVADAPRGMLRWRLTTLDLVDPPSRRQWWTPLSEQLWLSMLDPDLPVTAEDLQMWLLYVAPMVRDGRYGDHPSDEHSMTLLGQQWSMKRRAVSRILSRMTELGWMVSTHDGDCTQARIYMHWQTALMPVAEVAVDRGGDSADAPAEGVVSDAHAGHGGTAADEASGRDRRPDPVVPVWELPLYLFENLAQPESPPSTRACAPDRLLTPPGTSVPECRLQRETSCESGGAAAENHSSDRSNTSATRQREFRAGAVLWAVPRLRASIVHLPDLEFRWPARSVLARWLRKLTQATGWSADRVDEAAIAALTDAFPTPAPNRRTSAQGTGPGFGAEVVGDGWLDDLDDAMRALIVDARVAMSEARKEPACPPSTRDAVRPSWRQRLGLAEGEHLPAPPTSVLAAEQRRIQEPTDEVTAQDSAVAAGAWAIEQLTTADDPSGVARTLLATARRSPHGDHIRAAVTLWQTAR